MKMMKMKMCNENVKFWKAYLLKKFKILEVKLFKVCSLLYKNHAV